MRMEDSSGSAQMSDSRITSALGPTTWTTRSAPFPQSGLQWQPERVKHSAATEDDILLPVHFVGDRGIADAADRGMPQRRAVAGAQGHRAVRRIAGERQTRRRRQKAGGAFAANRMFPSHLAGPIVD